MLRAEIESLETKLALYRRREQLDLEYAAALTTDELRDRIAPIVQAVCAEFAITIENFWHGDRSNAHAIPRHVARYLVRELAHVGAHRIGAAFHCNPRNIFNSIAAVNALRSTDTIFADRLAKLRTALENK